MLSNKPTNFDTYIADFPKSTQELLEQLRATIKKAAPDAMEIISYGMPAFKLNKILVYFAARRNHIGFYPGASGIEVFKEEIKGYKWAKGSVQFPLKKPLPLELITRIVNFRVNEDQLKSKIKKI
jgi:uncharacterized protein YdhG (YjbR/CyaY superfamily)